MPEKLKFTVDGRQCLGDQGMTIFEAAKANRIYIPVLCHYEGLKPVGSCRICSVLVNGRWMAACTQPLSEGMAIENDTPQVNEYRRAIVEMLLAEGNHFCPACEKSGNCELQAVAYRLGILVPRFPYQFPKRKIEAYPGFLLEHNRCIQCQRCVRGIQTENSQKIFAMKDRSKDIKVNVDRKLATKLSPDQIQKAMDICPVGAILKKEVGFIRPIGQRKYDHQPIGSEIEGQK